MIYLHLTVCGERYCIVTGEFIINHNKGLMTHEPYESYEYLKKVHSMQRLQSVVSKEQLSVDTERYLSFVIHYHTKPSYTEMVKMTKYMGKSLGKFHKEFKSDDMIYTT